MSLKPLAKSEIVIRLLADNEHALVARLAVEGDGSDEFCTARALSEEMAGISEREVPPGRMIFGLFAGGHLAAVGCARLEGDAHGYISRVHAGRFLRRRGAARLLVEHMESYLREHGCRIANLYCWSHSVGTQRFWMKMGYTRVATRAHSNRAAPGSAACSTSALSGDSGQEAEAAHNPAVVIRCRKEL